MHSAVFLVFIHSRGEVVCTLGGKGSLYFWGRGDICTLDRYCYSTYGGYIYILIRMEAMYFILKIFFTLGSLKSDS